MFTPVINVDLDSLLESLGSFYTNLDDDSKTRIKVFWQSMLESFAGLYYDLRQNNLAKLLYYTQGYLEDYFKEFYVVFSGDNKNVSELKFNPPASVSSYNMLASADQTPYVYTITSITDYGETLPSKQATMITGAEDLSLNPNYVDWSLVSGVSSYGVYGRSPDDVGLLTVVSGVTYTLSGTYTFIDSGIYTPGQEEPESNTATYGYLYNIPDRQHYMTIPTLSGRGSGQILTENEYYEIEDLRKIKFIKPLSSGIIPGYISYNIKNAGYETSEVFIANRAISLLPILPNYYWKGLGIENPHEVTNDQYYYPKLSGIESETFFEAQLKYTKHLYHWTYGLSTVVRKPPTMTNIRHALGLLMGVAFSYYDGTVTNIDSDDNFKYITISGEREVLTYKVEKTLNLKYEEYDSVTRFDLLTDGTYASDYLDDFTLISGNTLKEGEIKEYDLFTQVLSSEDHKFRLLESSGRDITKVKTGDMVVIGV